VIAHHLSLTSIAVELAVVIGLVVGFGALWLRERRRRLRRDGSATMRDEV
jgi:hypothetical protein